MGTAGTGQPRTRRAITVRTGGVSTGVYESFNLGDHVGDDPQAVATNRQLLADRLGVSTVVWMEQLHSRTVTVVDAETIAAHRVPGQAAVGPLEATDAIVTNLPDVALATLTADCVPLLLSDDVAGVIAAVHAGRIGARIGIVPEVIATMVSLGAQPERIGVLMGPAAGPNYEVPPAMQADVESKLPGSATRTDKGTTGLDLRMGLTRQLAGLGITSVDRTPSDTMSDPRYFSYRRASRSGDGTTGRFASVIWMDTRPDTAANDAGAAGESGS